MGSGRRAPSSSTIFIILFLGVLASVFTQVGVMIYVVRTGMTRVPLPVPGYYFAGGILAVLFVSMILVRVEPHLQMKRALRVLFASAMIPFLNFWLLTSPPLFITGLLVVCILLVISWRRFRAVRHDHV